MFISLFKITEKRLLHLKLFFDSLQYVIGYPCIHRKLRNYIEMDGITTWAHVFCLYLRFETPNVKMKAVPIAQKNKSEQYDMDDGRNDLSCNDSDSDSEESDDIDDKQNEECMFQDQWPLLQLSMDDVRKNAESFREEVFSTLQLL